MRLLRFHDGSSEHEDFTTMLPLLALGSLSVEEQHGVNAHLRSACGHCPDTLRIYLDVAAALAGVFPEIRPSALGTRRVKRIVRRTAATR